MGKLRNCERCGRLSRRWRYSIPYAEFPPRKFATNRRLRKSQLGILELRVCRRCVWSHFRNEMLGQSILVMGAMLLLRLYLPDYSRISWPAVIAAIGVLICVVMALPFSPRGSNQFKRDMFSEHRSRLGLQHGVDETRLRPIIRW